MIFHLLPGSRTGQSRLALPGGTATLLLTSREQPAKCVGPGYRGKRGDMSIFGQQFFAVPSTHHRGGNSAAVVGHSRRQSQTIVCWLAIYMKGLRWACKAAG